MPSITETSFTLEQLALLAAQGIVFDKVITTNDIPEEGKALFPPGLLEILDPDRPWVQFIIQEAGNADTE